MSYKIRYTEETDDPDRFREFVWANTGGDCEVELVNDQGEVLDKATVVDGEVSFNNEKAPRQ